MCRSRRSERIGQACGFELMLPCVDPSYPLRQIATIALNIRPGVDLVTASATRGSHAPATPDECYDHASSTWRRCSRSRSTSGGAARLLPRRALIERRDVLVQHR